VLLIFLFDHTQHCLDGLAFTGESLQKVGLMSCLKRNEFISFWTTLSLMFWHYQSCINSCDTTSLNCLIL